MTLHIYSLKKHHKQLIFKMLNKSSAVAEMVDRARTKWAEKWGAAVPLSVGELRPHLTQCGQGRGLHACQVSSSSIPPFGHNTPTLQTDRQDKQRSDSIGRNVFRLKMNWVAIHLTMC